MRCDRGGGKLECMHLLNSFRIKSSSDARSMIFDQPRSSNST